METSFPDHSLYGDYEGAIMDLLLVEMILNFAIILLQFFLEISRASFDLLSLCFILSMFLAICCAVSFGLGGGKSFIAPNKFEFHFVSL